MKSECFPIQLSTVEYGEAWELQKILTEARMSNAVEDCLILLQHPPTFTFGSKI